MFFPHLFSRPVWLAGLISGCKPKSVIFHREKTIQRIWGTCSRRLWISSLKMKFLAKYLQPYDFAHIQYLVAIFVYSHHFIATFYQCPARLSRFSPFVQLCIVADSQPISCSLYCTMKATIGRPPSSVGSIRRHVIVVAVFLSTWKIKLLTLDIYQYMPKWLRTSFNEAEKIIHIDTYRETERNWESNSQSL